MTWNNEGTALRLRSKIMFGWYQSFKKPGSSPPSAGLRYALKLCSHSARPAANCRAASGWLPEVDMHFVLSVQTVRQRTETRSKSKKVRLWERFRPSPRGHLRSTAVESGKLHISYIARRALWERCLSINDRDVTWAETVTSRYVIVFIDVICRFGRWNAQGTFDRIGLFSGTVSISSQMTQCRSNHTFITTNHQVLFIYNQPKITGWFPVLPLTRLAQCHWTI